MNFDFSDEQKELARQARRILGARCRPDHVRSILEGEESLLRELWSELATLGYLGVAIPEAYGGAGLGYLELCILAEELGRAVAPLPMASSIYIAAELLKAAGSEQQKSLWLPRLASGDAIGAFALVEPVGPNEIRQTVKTSFEGDVVFGIKTAVTDGDVADLLIGAAREGSDGEISLFLLDLHGTGVTRERIDTVDPTRGHAKIQLSGARAERLGLRGDGTRLIADVLNRAAVLVAFEQVGGADRSLELACEYARERIAFGRPIGAFQAIKHLLADMYVAVSLARSNAYYGAWALSTSAVDLPTAAATARISATQAFQLCARNNIQVHGGSGFTWASDCHLFYRRSMHLSLTLGSPSSWEEQLIQCLATPRLF